MPNDAPPNPRRIREKNEFVGDEHQAIVVDDRALVIREVVSSTTFKDFRSNWFGLVEAQGCRLDNHSFAFSERAYNTLREHARSAPHKSDVRDMATSFLTQLRTLGLKASSTIRIVLCLGAAFDGKTSNNRIYISLDKCGDRLDGILLHELAHACTPVSTYSMIPFRSDKRLWSEALAIWCCGRLLEEEAPQLLGMRADNVAYLDGCVATLKDEFRRFRYSKPKRNGSIPSDPFLASATSNSRYVRYAYYLAYLLLKGYGDREVLGLLQQPRLVEGLVRRFLAIREHDEATAVSEVPPNQLTITKQPQYVILAKARASSWESHDEWLRNFSQAKRALQLRYNSVLDVGCGTGSLLEKISESSDRIVGIDSCSAMLAVAKRRNVDVQWIRADIAQWDSPECFDLVTASYDVVNHIAAEVGTRAALDIVCRRVRRKGTLIFDFISTAVANNSWTTIRSDGGWSLAEIYKWDDSAEHLIVESYASEPRKKVGLVFFSRNSVAPLRVSDVHIELGRIFSSVHVLPMSDLMASEVREEKRFFVVAYWRL